MKTIGVDNGAMTAEQWSAKVRGFGKSHFFCGASEARDSLKAVTAEMSPALAKKGNRTKKGNTYTEAGF